MSNRYMAVAGPNTNQWWVYDNVTDEYCDPPVWVLEKLQELKSVDEQEALLNTMANSDNNWINDAEFRYDADKLEI